MKNVFNIIYLMFLWGALAPLAVGAAEGAVDGASFNPEARKARIEQRIAECKADPDKCRAEFHALRARWCAANPERCQALEARFEKRRLECAADAEKCRAEFQARRAQWCAAHAQRCQALQALMEKRRAQCKADPQQCRVEREAHFEHRFLLADSDGNGLLSREEVQKALPRLARLSHHFERIDANRDGHISKEEIAAARKALFEQRRQRMEHRDRPNI
jgi:EF hand